MTGVMARHSLKWETLQSVNDEPITNLYSIRELTDTVHPFTLPDRRAGNANERYNTLILLHLIITSTFHESFNIIYIMRIKVLEAQC